MNLASLPKCSGLLVTMTVLMKDQVERGLKLNFQMVQFQESLCWKLLNLSGKLLYYYHFGLCFYYFFVNQRELLKLAFNRIIFGPVQSLKREYRLLCDLERNKLAFNSFFFAFRATRKRISASRSKCDLERNKLAFKSFIFGLVQPLEREYWLLGLNVIWRGSL